MIRSAEEELSDPERQDLKMFIRDNCGVGAGEDDIDILADIVASSKINIDTATQQAFPALFLTGGLMSHSCLPNTRLMFEKVDGEEDEEAKAFGGPSLYRMTAYSSVKIARGEKISRSSITGLLTKGTRVRRRELRRRALVQCSCQRYCHQVSPV